VSLVDPEFGVLGVVGSGLATVPALKPIAEKLETKGGDEENPQDMSYGEYWAYTAMKAVLESPSWPRTLLIYTYDEHGGYYDHVPPPRALAPDSIAPQLGPGDVPGGYDIYGPRVPAVVASPYSIPNGVTDLVHDHTSVLATIEAKWNLPRLTYRDANARTLADFLDFGHAALLHPPAITEPPVPVPAGSST
jgi:phospholipase C